MRHLRAFDTSEDNEALKLKVRLSFNYTAHLMSAAISAAKVHSVLKDDCRHMEEQWAGATSQHSVCVCVRHVHDYCHYNSGQVIRLDPHQLRLACQPRSCAKCLVLPDSPLAG